MERQFIVTEKGEISEEQFNEVLKMYLNIFAKELAIKIDSITIDFDGKDAFYSKEIEF